jgi:hypothetical protein
MAGLRGGLVGMLLAGRLPPAYPQGNAQELVHEGRGPNTGIAPGVYGTSQRWMSNLELRAAAIRTHRSPC